MDGFGDMRRYSVNGLAQLTFNKPVLVRVQVSSP